MLEWCQNQSCWEQLGYSGKYLTCKVKASSWPLATSCSSSKRNISALRTACVKAIKRHNNNNNNSNSNNNNNNNNDSNNDDDDDNNNNNNNNLFGYPHITMALHSIIIT